jgi:hypothetical protein
MLATFLRFIITFSSTNRLDTILDIDIALHDLQYLNQIKKQFFKYYFFSLVKFILENRSIVGFFFWYNSKSVRMEELYLTLQPVLKRPKV